LLLNDGAGEVKNNSKDLMIRRPAAITFFEQFLMWWGKELLTLFPLPWRQRIAGTRTLLLLQIVSQDLHVVLIDESSSTDLGLFSLDEEGVSNFSKEVARIKAIDNAEAILVLTAEQKIDRTILLPKEAASNFREVIGFELDRYTPFNISNACFDTVRTYNDLAKNKIEVRLAVTSRHLLEGFLVDLSLFGLSPSIVSFSNNLVRPLQGDGLNLLPATMRPKRTRKWPLILAALFCILFAELLLIMSYPYQHAANQVDELQAEIATIQNEVRSISDTRSGLEQVHAQVGELLEQANQRPFVVDIMKELGSRLPSETWLTQFQLKGASLHIQGYSQNAAGLIRRLDDSLFFKNTRFTSPMASDKPVQQTFKISLDIINGRGDVSAAIH